MTAPPSRATTALAIVALLVGLADVVLLLDRTDTRPTAVASPTPRPSPSPPETLDEQLARVARTVEAIRGLRFPAVPEASYLTADQIAARLGDILAEYTPEQAETDRRILRSLGALPRDYDLRGGLLELLEEQVAGFYDPATGEMVVLVDDGGTARLSPLEELFLAHELEHALADAVLGLPEDPQGEIGEDAALAASALVEGDASLTMQEYVVQGLSTLDQLRLAGESFGTLGQLEVLEQVPWVLRRSLEFPYLEGLAFVTRLRAAGGWAAVDAAYARPPTSTAEVLFPERYLAEVPVQLPPPPGDPGSGWERRTTIAFGAADLLFLLEAPGDDRAAALDEPRRRAAAWAGGQLTLWTAGEQDVVTLVLVDRGPAGELCDTVVAWYLRAFTDVEPVPRRDAEVLAADGPIQDVVARCDGPTVRLAVAPDVATARAALG